MEPADYFDVLGIDSTATLGEIKKAYRKLVFKYHPDHNESKTARKEFIRIANAYTVLVDPVKKDEYVKRKGSAVTDKPWELLENYWKLICEKGFHL